MILNSRCESFAKTRMFLQAFQKLPQNVQQKIGRGRECWINDKRNLREYHLCSKQDIENAKNLQR